MLWRPTHRRPAEASSNLARFDGMHYGHRTEQKADLIRTTRNPGPRGSARKSSADHDGTSFSPRYKDAYYVKASRPAGW